MFWDELKKTLKVLLIAFAIIAFWRGIWGLMDVYVFPNKLWLSYLISIIIGIAIIAISIANNE